MNKTDKVTAIGLSLSVYIALHIVTLLALSAFVGAIYNVFALLFKIMKFGILVLAYSKLTGYVPFKKERIAIDGRAVLEFVFAFSITTVSVNIVGYVTEKLLTALGVNVPQSAFPSDAGAFVFMFLGSVLFAALTEEIVFRGAVMDALDGFGEKTRILISGALFALVHCNLLQIPYAFVAGTVISAFFVKTGSLFYAVALHFTSNLLTYLFTVLRAVANEKTVKTVSDTTFVLLAIIAVTGLIYFILRAVSANKTEKEAPKLKFKSFFTAGAVIYAVFTVLLALINTF